MDDYRTCFLCGRNGSTDRLERHHIFGAANRNRSEKYGLVVWLCGESCHRNGKYAVHQCKETADYIHKYGQEKCMREQGMSIDDFRAEFGKNYL